MPTDYDEKNKTYKTSSIKEVIKYIRRENRKALIIIKSTVMVGFTRSLNDNNIIFCPEFLKEGTALYDSLFPSRIIVGVKDNNPSINRFIGILRSSIKNTAPTIIMSYEEAEATKLISNTYLAIPCGD